jgi:hypothetical protein
MLGVVIGLGGGDVVVEIAQPAPVGRQGPTVKGRLAAGGGDRSGQLCSRHRLAGVRQQDGDVAQPLGVGDVGLGTAEGDRPDRAIQPEPAEPWPSARVIRSMPSACPAGSEPHEIPRPVRNASS